MRYHYNPEHVYLEINRMLLLHIPADKRPPEGAVRWLADLIRSLPGVRTVVPVGEIDVDWYIGTNPGESAPWIELSELTRRSARYESARTTYQAALSALVGDRALRDEDTWSEASLRVAMTESDWRDAERAMLHNW